MSLQMSMIAPGADWQPPRLSSLPDWPEHGRVCVDVETKDPDLRKLGPGVRRDNTHLAGVGFAIEDGPSFYLPIRHAGGDNVDEANAIRYLRDQADRFKGVIVGANLQYDLDWLQEYGVNYQPSRFADVQVAEPLIDDLRMSYSLAAIAESYGLEGKDETLLREAAESHGLDPKRDLWKLPARYVGAYAEQDVRLPLELLRLQMKEIEAQDLAQIWELESRVLPVLVKMRRRGVRIDFDRLEQIEKFSQQEEKKALDEVKRRTGIRVKVGDVWKAEALAAVVRELGVEPDKTPKTKKPKVDTELLEKIQDESASLLLWARRVNKLRTTFVESIRRYAVGDRIHCTFNQLRRTEDDSGDDEVGARYGRLSSTDPNLQQQPARDPELGPMWRSVYVPDEGGEWCCIDFSQQEPRWLAHYAELTKCRGAYALAERYRNDPKTDNHNMMTQLVHGDDVVNWDNFKKLRTDCKIIFLGLCYGMGAGKLCRSLGYDVEWKMVRGQMRCVAGPEGVALLDTFHEKVPFIRQLSQKCERRARARGYIRTVLGRRCRFPRDAQGNYDWTHKALNRLIQGSSADQTKQAMVDADADGLPIQLQVHDELDFTIWDRSEAERLSEIMRTCTPCNVPHLCDIEVGPSWGEIK